METEKAWRTSLEVVAISTGFENLIKGLHLQSDVDTFNSIAVAMEKLKLYVSRDYPDEFLRMAESIESLGISMIGPGPFGKHIEFWATDHIRNTFGGKDKAAS